MTNVIPFFGPFIGAIPATLLILIQNPIKALWFVLFVLVLQQVDGNIIGPKILGNTTGLSSFWELVIHGLRRNEELDMLNTYHDNFGDPADDAAAQPAAPQSAENQ